ncbi:HAD hydrolase-like protein [Pseudonocardia xishanensis]|uniref:HAD-IIA family hydrolase n=1 Tax=Pseudonocardia xishanensis TaxID=630995 RepID=A0ABP8RZA8_9PSEU
MSDLLSGFDLLLADLDGTLYAGREAVPGAVAAITGAAQRGVRTAYVTNNASRRPADVAAHLSELGFPAATEDVRTSSQAGASLLAEQLPAGAKVLVLGTDALRDEVAQRGLTPIDTAAGADAVIHGHSPDTGWRQLAEATLAIRAGAVWVATNIDPTLPTERGPMPGNGSMVGVVRIATGLEPQVAGKPAPTLLSQAAVGAERPLVIGDRLDTDIEGGNAAGLPTLLVLTGVSTAREALEAAPELRPTYIGADLGVLTQDPGTDGWTVREGVLTGDGEPIAALRALCAAHWSAGGGPATVRGEGDAARHALDSLGLA